MSILHDAALHRGLARMRRAFDGLLATRSLDSLTPAEVELEAQWQQELEPVLTDLYWYPLRNGVDAAPEQEGELRRWLRDHYKTAAAIAALLLLLKRYQVKASNTGGNMALDLLSLDGTFRLTNADYLAELDAQAEELTSLDTDLSLIDTTVDDLTTGIPAAREEDNPLTAIGLMIAGWAAYRSDMIAATEESRQVNNGLNWTYRENKVEMQQFHAREDACPICLPHNGEIVPVDDPGDIDPPIHPGCRCVWIPVLDNWTKPDDTWLGD